VRLAVVVPFLDEQESLPALLASLAAQDRLPDRLLLVDDGSSDASPQIAEQFTAAHPWAKVVRVPPRPRERDRLRQAHELRALQWGVERLDEPWDVVGKVDADLVLTPDVLSTLDRELSADPQLGVAGVRLADPDGSLRTCPDGHVEGAVSFYRRACWEAIAPLPPIIGWDTIDEVRARVHGFRVAAFTPPAGPSLHGRRMGSFDGVLRGYRRAGRAAWAYGAHPVVVLASTATRLRHRPRVLCGASYLAGWAQAAVAGGPRAEREVRDRVRREQRDRLRGLVVARAAGRNRAGDGTALAGLAGRSGSRT